MDDYFMLKSKMGRLKRKMGETPTNQFVSVSMKI